MPAALSKDKAAAEENKRININNCVTVIIHAQTVHPQQAGSKKAIKKRPCCDRRPRMHKCTQIKFNQISKSQIVD